MTVAQIGDVLGVSRTTVYRTLRREVEPVAGRRGKISPSRGTGEHWRRRGGGGVGYGGLPVSIGDTTGADVGDFQAFRPDPQALQQQFAQSRAAVAAELARAGRNTPTRPGDVEPYVTERVLSEQLPEVISRVYVVTGHQSEAFDDFYGALAQAQRPMVERRSVSLGTADTPAEIAATLSAIPSASNHVVVLVRGGGSRGEDLWAFDHPNVVNAIIEARNPILTALGHRGNVFWADHVATASMPVPGMLGQAMRVALRQRYFAAQKPRLNAAPKTAAPQPRRSTPTRPTYRASSPRHGRAERPAASASPFQAPAPVYPTQPARPVPMFAPGRQPPPRQWTWGATSIRRPRGFGVASLVLGLISAFAAGGFLILPIVGLVLGMIDLRRRPRKAAIAGVIINSLVLVGMVLSLLLLVAAGMNTPSPSPIPSSPTG
ncbi:exonuclease VII large subunit [Curtobacterium sp. PhB191]|nr:exonuclease VII large subunit [Curtobacterium sp. PhB191]